MTKQITRNQIHGIKKAVPYCALQTALKFYDRSGYAAGVYGWNYDAYEIGSAAILTGYRPEGRKVDLNKCQEIERTAAALIAGGALMDPGKAYNARAILTAMIEQL